MLKIKKAKLYRARQLTIPDIYCNIANLKPGDAVDLFIETINGHTGLIILPSSEAHNTALYKNSTKSVQKQIQEE